MSLFITLDSAPLGLILQRAGSPKGQECRDWLARHATAGARILVPEIIDYEVRRELLRLKLSNAIDRLDRFYANSFVMPIPLTSEMLHLAAELWAKARQHGVPTADPHALDIDVILAAQVLLCGVPAADVTVATSNVGHLSQFVSAAEWTTI